MYLNLLLTKAVSKTLLKNLTFLIVLTNKCNSVRCIVTLLKKCKSKLYFL